MIDSSERWQHWVYTFIDGSRNDNVAVFFLLFFDISFTVGRYYHVAPDNISLVIYKQ